MSNLHVDAANEWMNDPSESDYQPSAYQLKNAQVEATLAIAYEQSTANMIALWSNPQASIGDTTWSMGEETAGRLLGEILERLGVKP